MFQSTCPARGTTCTRLSVPNEICLFQSTCPARGTTETTDDAVPLKMFQSTCPARGTTQVRVHVGQRDRVSIHVPRAGHDRRSCYADCFPRCFNPRAPRGARLGWDVAAVIYDVFQSTCPARGTTGCSIYGQGSSWVSIHVPRAGHDSTSRPVVFSIVMFQSTCPARGTTSTAWTANTSELFQSTCPARGATAAQAWGRRAGDVSIHVPRAGHDKDGSRWTIA